MKLLISARRNIFRGGGSKVHQGRACKGGRRVGGSGGRSPPDAGEILQKFVKKALKKLQLFKNFQEKFAIFWKCYRIFGENVDENLEICICRGFGGGAEPPPEASEFTEIWLEK